MGFCVIKWQQQRLVFIALDEAGIDLFLNTLLIVKFTFMFTL